MYRCQSAHKLVELDARFHLFARFHPHTVVDLAAAPGGFAQVALERMQSAAPQAPSSSPVIEPPPMVIAVDQRPIQPLPGLVTVRGNILQHQQMLQSVQRTLHPTPSRSSAAADVGPPRTVDMVLHDGVSVVKGQHAFSVTYAQNQMALSTLLLASKMFLQFGPAHDKGETRKGNRTEREMKPHTDSPSSSNATTPGNRTAPSAHPTSATLPVCFVSKLLRSLHSAQVVAATSALFRYVSVVKPQASRAESQETYIVAMHFQPHRWQQLVNFERHHGHREAETRERSRSKWMPKRHSLEINPSLFSMPPAVEDCGDARRMVWSCLGCGRTCMGVQPCVQCGAFASASRAGCHRGT
ncbi:hypothetical protein ABB37_09504 [Leptomonas pyrrhocoris]|uniref:Ribosomal RNA methyltransferase FtsJ domain-containing protein n=1 Tax=Leptomonas pyrrhocoris TaxID=157538 RepID=A0A0N0DQZ2_LEPPY|nr:hypothetical protein ABB37_09504 [Leptomonas pyrrhocoris]XP_015652327.1 hypothetical protein ABB37_09504 [Leptomonas pyrrhocoris]KPA73887.1 hypothetical protein ABB37_09504 [Leptomonas pyrrhocoris]KPA73888.1 hypothetical protein ABB37_09504 [Leptomonas pyrrhocoris]|eukprot:XP_015652326.1 hypothetical protein ABB37_09504 [Leptomonas pyrrhocoris]